MADIALLSAFLQAIFENVGTLILDELNLESELKREVKNLTDTLAVIQMFLKDADEKQQNSGAVRLWLEQLKDVAYDASDLLDEISYEAKRRQLIKFNKVRNSVTVSLLNLDRRILAHGFSQRVKNMKERGDEMQGRCGYLGLLKMTAAHHPDEGRELFQTTSLNPSSFIGRDDVKNWIIRLLVSSDGTGGSVSVISLLGMGGLGKTTVAKLVYNDETVENHFELRLWVHVSREFNVSKITGTIVESIDGSSAFALNSLDSRQKLLQSKLSGQKYLLVLDDVWEENPREWMQLKDSLLCGAKGSKILVTTRSEEVANLPGCTSLCRLQTLSNDDCWTLFCRHALDSNHFMGPDSDNIRREVLNKCRGVPLVAEVIGMGLRRESDRSKWGAILQNPMWEFSGGDSDISKSIRLSYERLDSHLRPCFAYCSIIPRGFVFDMEVLVQLWMAQNFIQPGRGERIEDAGERYFKSLLRLSFFQYSHFDCKNNRAKYTMHSVIHEFAQHVSGEECCILENHRTSNNSLEKTRHASLLCRPFQQFGSRQQSSTRKSIFDTIYTCKGLYTLLAAGLSPPYTIEVPDDIGDKLCFLRALDFSYSTLAVLPDSIGNLKHLRYLQLRNTNIRRLPKSLGCLYSLQTLGLGNCYDLEELPQGTEYLRKLRHLDLHLDLHLDDDSVILPGGSSSMHKRGSRLRSMPPNIGRLTDLQTLSRFVVSKQKRCGLTELQNLNNIHGELHISNLQLVMNRAEASNADLLSKEYLERLELEWIEGGSSISIPYTEKFEAEILFSLKPHQNLKELKVVGYRGVAFPPWIGNSYFSSLVTLMLSDCKRCKDLPTLGQLPMLKSLYIEGMDAVELVDCKLCGNEERRFPSLQKLQFGRMRKMQVWCGDEGCGLPSLRELVIKDCVDLRQLTHNLPSLAKLEIEGSRWFMGLPRIPSLHSLEVNASGEWIWSWPFLTSLSSLTISQVPTVTIPLGLNSGHGSIRRLEISNCYQLTSLADNWLPTSLTYLAIKHCPQFCALPGGLENLVVLEDMEIEDCTQLHSFPYGLPPTLQFLSITDCPALSQQCRGQGWAKIARIPSVWIDKQLVAFTAKS